MKPRNVLFWIAKGHIVTEKEIEEQLRHLAEHCETPYPSTFNLPFAASQAVADYLQRPAPLLAHPLFQNSRVTDLS
jgi:hypothetical protein